MRNIFIIMLLAAIIVPSMIGYTKKSEQQKAKMNDSYNGTSDYSSYEE
mgnify:CR=1 FL=1